MVKFKRGRQLTYGEVRKIANENGKAFCGLTDYHEGQNRPSYSVWDLSISDGKSPSLLLDSGSWRMDVDIEDFRADDDLFDFEDEDVRLVLYEAVPKVTAPKKTRK